MMSTRLESLSATGHAGRLHPSIPAWIIGLAAALAVPFLLPLPGSPVALAGFLGLSGILILFARHWLIAVLPVLAALGPYFLPLAAAGVNVFGFRLLIMLLAVFSTPLTNRGGWWFNPVARWSAMFVLFWVVWGFLSLLWAPSTGAALADVITLVFALGLLLTLLSLDAYKAAHLDKLRIGWVLALATTAMSALLEIARGYGLPRDLTDQMVVAGVSLDPAGLDPAIRSTLSFSSDFGGFLLLTVPFVLWSMERATGLFKLAYLVALGVVGALILYSASRLGLIGFMAQLLVYGLVLQRRWYMSLVVLAGILAAGVMVTTFVADSNLRVSEKLGAIEGGGDRSMRHRVALTLNGLWMVYKTGGRGIGAAGFDKEIAGDVPVRLPIPSETMEWNAHNFWIEVLSEYGVPLFVAYMALLAWIGRLGWRAQRRAGGSPRAPAMVGRAIVIGLIGYLFCGVASGSIMPKPTHWMFFVSLVLMAAFLDEVQRSKRRSSRPAGGEVVVPS